MIIGIGTDLVDIHRIERLLERFGNRFVLRCFAPVEQVEPGPRTAAHYAKRFAAKEACAKALGTGIADGVKLRDISIRRGQNGAPVLMLADGAFARLQNIAPSGMKAVLHVTLTDSESHAQAFVVIEAL
ncbi:MAG: holo-ACP synthase [Pseudomonadota bacterium]|nr:holo-ACP synthase [Pseudomonadota bacterium]